MRKTDRIARYARTLTFAAATLVAACAQQAPPTPAPPPAPAVATPAPLAPLTGAALVDDLQKRSFLYFWETGDRPYGLVPDRYPYKEAFSSIAAIGFGLTAYAIGAEHGWITREQARERTLVTLRFFANARQGPELKGTSGYKGFFHHFLNLENGTRYSSWVELSSVDTTLLLGGVLFAQSYYDRDDAPETEIRTLAETIYGRVDWPFMQVRPPALSMGWHPETGFIPHDWIGYNEAMLVYVLALGSPTHPIGPEAWTAWTQGYAQGWGTYQGQEHLNFGPLFGHQYSHVWIDFRGIADAYMRGKGIDYFENSRRATYAQRSYAVENPMGWADYGENVWGLTASDGPQATVQSYRGTLREFRHYSARGAALVAGWDDGTIAPTAAASSMPFAPEIVQPAIEEMYRRYGKVIYSTYGFLDAFNRSYAFTSPALQYGRQVEGFGWVADDWLGIDQGPIVAMIENHRNGFVWNVMRKNAHIRRGLERAGFTGGWLDEGKPR